MQKRIYYTAKYCPNKPYSISIMSLIPVVETTEEPQNKFIFMEDPHNLNPLCISLYNYAKECTLAVHYSYLPKPSSNWHTLPKKLSL